MALVLRCFCVALATVCLSTVGAATQPSGDRPPWQHAAGMARWLVHRNDWGTLSTLSRHLSSKHSAVPYGNVVSYSDGPQPNSTGRLLFYLTKMDATAFDLEVNSMATLTIAEAQLPDSCSGTDPEDPTCAKVSISGEVEPVRGRSLPQALRLLFARHPAMRDWPADHGFQAYEMHIRAIRLLDYYGGPHDIEPGAYFEVQLGAADLARW